MKNITKIILISIKNSPWRFSIAFKSLTLICSKEIAYFLIMKNL